MLIAIDENGNLTHVQDAIKAKRYYCPDCHQQLVIHHRNGKSNNFAHYNSSRHRTGESKEHLLGKHQIYEWAQHHGWAPALEVYLPAIDQRADVMLQVGNQPVAIEFQCSPLTLNQIQERNWGYAKAGIKVKWFLGQRYLRRLHSPKVAQFTQFHNQLEIPFWDTRRNRLIYRRNYSQCSFRVSRSPNKKVLIYHQTMRLQRERKQFHSLFNVAYQNGHIASCCPLFTHDLISRWPVMHEPIIVWRIRTLLALEQLPLGLVMTNKEWFHWLGRQAIWLSFPCLTPGQRNNLQQEVLRDWLYTLLRAEIIHQSSGQLCYWHKPSWFSNLDQKLMVIK